MPPVQMNLRWPSPRWSRSSLFLASDDKVLVCTHATFRFAVEDLGIQAFDERLVAIDEFHHKMSSNSDNILNPPRVLWRSGL